jgi:hypothetical protein
MKFPTATSDLVVFGRRPSVVLFSSLGLALYLAYHLLHFHILDLFSLRGDASGLFYQAKQIFALHSYPQDTIFPYPPSAVIIVRSLGLGGAAVFMGVWCLLITAALIAIIRASLAQEVPALRQAWVAIGLVAVVLTDSPVSWDLRNVNSNLIYLGLVMAGYALLGSLPVIAGIMIGLSVSLKLYSGLLLIWLIVNREIRAAAGATVTIVLFWVLLPICFFGLQGTEHLYEGWFGQLRAIAAPALHDSLAKSNVGPPLVTVQQAVAFLTGGSFASDTTLKVVSLLWVAWLSALLLYCVRWYRSAFPAQTPSRAILADWVVLLVAPLPFSIWLEPYHLVPFLVAALLALAVVMDESMLRADRFAALGILTVFLLFLLFKVPFEVRGLGILAELFVLAFVLAFMRPRFGGPVRQFGLASSTVAEPAVTKTTASG